VGPLGGYDSAGVATLEGGRLALLFTGEDNLLIGARKGSPLAIGYGKGEMYLGSDAIALAPFTDTICYLEDGDWAVLTRNGVDVFDAGGSKVERAVLKSSAAAFLVDKGNYRHFMAKEIHEQPEVVGHTLAQYLDRAAERVRLPGTLPFNFRALRAGLHVRVRHRLLRWAGRKILVRALCAPAGRDRSGI
jgi:glutamine---fructose-6-phosphate transaminase (isomerizing)